MAAPKKNAARRRATLVFLDESGFSERPAIRRTWAPKGCTPVLRPRGRSWRQLSAIGALAFRPWPAPTTRLLLRLHKGSVRSRQIVVFLRHLARHIPGPIVLIWDGLNAHRSRETRAYLASQRRRFTVVRLPSYSPDLNPVEGLWGWLKGHAVPNLCAPDLEPVRQGVRRGCRHLARRPDTVAGFLDRTGLSF